MDGAIISPIVPGKNERRHSHSRGVRLVDRETPGLCRGDYQGSAIGWAATGRFCGEIESLTLATGFPKRASMPRKMRVEYPGAIYHPPPLKLWWDMREGSRRSAGGHFSR
jgi:hypothetical protein